MTFDEAMTRIAAAGYGGFETWTMGGEYLCCLKSDSFERLSETTLWNWQKTAQIAMEKIVAAAELSPKK